jgi:hypothetical protein
MQKYNTSDQHAHESNANGHNDGWIELGFFDRGAIFTRVGTKTVTISLDTANTMATALVWAGADWIVESFVAPSSFGWASWMRWVQPNANGRGFLGGFVTTWLNIHTPPTPVQWGASGALLLNTANLVVLAVCGLQESGHKK